MVSTTILAYKCCFLLLLLISTKLLHWLFCNFLTITPFLCFFYWPHYSNPLFQCFLFSSIQELECYSTLTCQWTYKEFSEKTDDNICIYESPGGHYLYIDILFYSLHTYTINLMGWSLSNFYEHRHYKFWSEACLDFGILRIYAISNQMPEVFGVPQICWSFLSIDQMPFKAVDFFALTLYSYSCISIR